MPEEQELDRRFPGLMDLMLEAEAATRTAPASMS